ncbi:MAG: tetratricopeptide repeat protein [Flavobacteriales bacterium]
MLRVIFSISLLLAFVSANCQPNNEAYKLGVEGILKVDNGDYKEGIKLLQKARNLEPGEYDYAFELAKAHMKSGNPKKAEKYLFDLQYHQAVQGDLYVLLSECYAELEVLKKTPNPENKRSMDALRYGIQKLPNNGMLYLHLAQRNLEIDRVVEALSVLETGIKKAPNFAENYYWASKLLLASGNNLWAWFYAEIFYNMTEDLNMRRSAAVIINISSKEVFSKDWNADPEKLDQDFAFVSSEKCQTESSNNIDVQLEKRACMLANWDYQNFTISPLFERMKVIQDKGWNECLVWSIMESSDKEKFLAWLNTNTKEFEAFREWRYWNPLTLKNPIIRLAD